MSMLYAYKPRKDRALRSVSRALLAIGVTPNMVTASGLLLSAAAGVAAMSGHLYAGIALFLAGVFVYEKIRPVLGGSSRTGAGSSA
jgi:CDP-diacylglycerol--glycerol-3-phosphate 3-phosphatidyltransferase